MTTDAKCVIRRLRMLVGSWQKGESPLHEHWLSMAASGNEGDVQTAAAHAERWAVADEINDVLTDIEREHGEVMAEQNHRYVRSSQADGSEDPCYLCGETEAVCAAGRCPSCGDPYPAPLTGVAMVICGACGHEQCFSHQPWSGELMHNSQHSRCVNCGDVEAEHEVRRLRARLHYLSTVEAHHG